MELLLQPEAGEGAVRQYNAWADGHLLGWVRSSAVQGWLRVTVDDALAITRTAERQSLLAAIVRQAQADHLSGVVVTADAHLLLRHEARSGGFTGPLRGDLVWDLRHPLVVAPQDATDQDRAQRVLSQLEVLLPGVRVEADRPAGRLRSFVRSASGGVGGVVHLKAQQAPDALQAPDAAQPLDAKPLWLAVPLTDDVMPEGVALIIDTALAVRRRFRPLVDGVRIFLDQSAPGLGNGKWAGLAEQTVRDIHLTPAYVLVREMEALEDHLLERRSPPPSGPAPRPRSFREPSAFTRIDAVVAHEYWHQIEFDLDSRRYRDSVEFRRAVGGYFGVETLEHVIKGKAADAPVPWKVAYARLAEEVSTYATTNPKEAAAELFSQWWCTAASAVPPPSAQAFGQIVQRFFPTRDRAR